MVFKFPAFCFLAIFVSVFYTTSGKGTFFVGFLGYANPSNQKSDGECCDDVRDDDGCHDYCDLLFEVSVKGLGGAEPEWRRPSQEPIDNDDVILFPSAYEGVINPMTFSFDKWPGNVTVTVNVKDQDNDTGQLTEELVDSFSFKFIHSGSSVEYIYLNQTGEREHTQSELRMVYRYECDFYFYGNDCATDCLLEENKGNSEICPSVETPLGTTEAITDWIIKITTQKSTRDKKCQNLNPESNFSNSNCSSVTSEITTFTRGLTDSNPTTEGFTYIKGETTFSQGTRATDASFTTENILPTTALPTSVQTYESANTRDHTFTTYNRPESTPAVNQATKSSTSTSTKPSYSNYESTFSAKTKTSKPSLTTTQPTTTLKPNNKSIKNISLFSPVITITRSSPASSAHTQNTNLIPTTPTSGDGGGGGGGDGGPMDYWPAIVGGILGAIALIAGVSVFLYFRNQKAKLKSTQEIYNVNPRQWTLQPPQENGTSHGMTEIALETEEV